MRLVFVALILPALVLAAPEKRYILGDLLNLINLGTIKQDLQLMLDTIGGDPTEQLCEQECHKIAQQSLLDHGCPLLCHSFQELVHHFHIVPDITTTVSA